MPTSRRPNRPRRSRWVGLVLALTLGLLPTLPVAGQAGVPNVVRVVSDNTVDVAIKFSELTFTDTDIVDRVLLGREELFADSLAGGVLSGNAPLLLTSGGFLSDHTINELRRLAPRLVTILGGTAAVSAEVETHLSGLGYAVERLAGPTRLETAIAIADSVDSRSAIVARAFPAEDASDPTQAFADSLSAAGLAADTGRPILLTQTDVLSEATREHIAATGYEEVTIIGGTAAISDTVEAELEHLVGSVARLAGPTRFDTAVAVNDARGLQGSASGGALVISEGQDPDAWAPGFASATVASRLDAPVVFTSEQTVPAATAAFLSRTGEAPETVICAAHPTACAEAEALLGVDLGPLPDLIIEVDPAVTPTTDRILDVDGNPTPVGAASDGDGGDIDFATTEILVIGDDDDLDMALELSGGTLQQSTPFADELSAATTDLGAFHVIELAAAPPDLPDLAESVRQIDPYDVGTIGVSDEAALGLLATTAHLVANGIAAGANIIPELSGVIDRDIAESPTSQIVDYDPNPFTWRHLNGPNRYEVPETWRALQMAGNIPPAAGRFDFGIMDGGFLEDSEVPSSSGVDSSPATPACGGTCPYHGFETTALAIGEVNNGRGTAGVAGELAQGRFVSIGDGGFRAVIAGWIGGIGTLAGSDVINMSINARLPLGLGWLASPLNAVTYVLSETGIGLFASAGNVDGGNADDANVDREGCFTFFCRELHRVVPCELSGVTCIGGVAATTTDRHPDSWYGPDDVDLWAPFEVFVGPVASSSGQITDGVIQRGGTSFSSPYAAGAYLLVKAANPDLGRESHLALLAQTARRGTNGAGDIVQPFRAVTRIFNGNRPFDVEWQQPSNLTTLHTGDILPLIAVVTDPDDQQPTYEWLIDGEVVGGEGPAATLNARTELRTFGTHLLTFRVSDGPFTYEERRVMVYRNSPPAMTIEAPFDGQMFTESQTIALSAQSVDRDEEFPFDLADDQIVWRAGSAVIAQGHTGSILAGSLGVGANTISVRGTDPEGTVGVSQVAVTVVADTENTPPGVPTITSPEDGTDEFGCCSDEIGVYVEVDLLGQAEDLEDGPLTGESLVWTTTADEDGDGTRETRLLGTGPSLPATRLYDDGGSTQHTIRLIATDSEGLTSSMSVNYFISRID